MQHRTNVVGGGLPLVGEIGGQHHFLHDTIGRSRQHPVEGQFLGADAVKRTHSAHEHVIEPVVGVSLLHGIEIDGHLDHAQQ